MESDEARRIPDIYSDSEISLIALIEREKTLRIFWIGLFSVIGLGLIVYGVVHLMSRPAWLDALIVVLAALFGPSGVIALLIRSRRRFAIKTHTRIVELERTIDAARQSSGEEPSVRETPPRRFKIPSGLE